MTLHLIDHHSPPEFKLLEFTNKMQNFGPLSNSPFLFLLLTLCLVHKWLNVRNATAFRPEDVRAWWLLMIAFAVISFWSSLKILNRLFLTTLSRFPSSPLLVHLSLPLFPLPVSYSLICLDKLPCQQIIFLVMLMILFQTIVEPAVFPITVVVYIDLDQEIHSIYCLNIWWIIY